MLIILIIYNLFVDNLLNTFKYFAIILITLLLNHSYTQAVDKVVHNLFNEVHYLPYFMYSILI